MTPPGYVPVENLAMFLCTLDPSMCRNAEARFLIQQFQRDAEVLGPGAAHRRAIKLLESLGADLPPAFHQPLTLTVAK